MDDGMGTQDPIPTSLLKLSADHASRAVKIFALILKYTGDAGDTVSAQEGVAICNKLLREGLKRPELRDELYAQLSKQTRNNPDLQSALKAWELMHLVSATTPPSKEFVSYVSEYIHDSAHDAEQPPEVRALALKAWGSLKRCAKAGPRRTVPTAEEIEALRTGRTLNTIVFFLDETFEEFHYDITTTVLEVRGLHTHTQTLASARAAGPRALCVGLLAVSARMGWFIGFGGRLSGGLSNERRPALPTWTLSRHPIQSHPVRGAVGGRGTRREHDQQAHAAKLHQWSSTARMRVCTLHCPERSWDVWFYTGGGDAGRDREAAELSHLLAVRVSEVCGA